ncbi:unnamed protein product [Moneuplotes crassus]|uniref:ferroxidase n=1 Tax=Euplotes crassus TaxID=5936 RepID=A0AAD1XUS7_EUPCR|nr:unnamed protein product [Moneuplotes crassus]
MLANKRLLLKTLSARSAFFFCSIPSDKDLPMSKYHEISDHFLESLCEQFEAIDQSEIDDVILSQGVLRIDLADEKSTYIINKQSPNKQIWLSSPMSGPYRFDLDLESNKWVGKGEDCILDLLSKELSEWTGEEVQFVYENDLL